MSNKESKQRSKANLILFKKGVSGNPKGRPKGSVNFSTILSKLLKQKIDYKDTINKKSTKTSLSKVIGHRLIELALHDGVTPADRLKAIKAIIEVVDGKPMQQINEEPETQATHDDIIDIMDYEDSIKELKTIKKSDEST